MDVNNLIKKRRLFSNAFFLLICGLTLILISPVKANALDTQNIIFSSDHKENIVGYYDGKVPSLNVTLKNGVTSFNLVVYDKNNNVINPSFFQGELPVDKNLYPLKIVCNPQQYESNWSIRCSVTYKDIADDLEEKLKKMDKMIKLLNELKDKLAEMNNTLSSLNDFLSNPKYLEEGLQDLEDSVMALTQLNPVADAGNTANMFKGGLTGTSGNANFEAMFDYMGIKVNLMNFSAIASCLGSIRNLLKAMIWIEFAVFCLKIVVPKFKV